MTQQYEDYNWLQAINHKETFHVIFNLRISVPHLWHAVDYQSIMSTAPPVRINNNTV